MEIKSKEDFMVGPKTFNTCPCCGQGVKILTGTMSTGSGSLLGSCPNCHKMVRLVVQNGIPVGIKPV